MAINAFNENKSYNSGDFVIYSSNIFCSLSSSNLGNTPDVTGDTEYWELKSPSIRKYSSTTTYSVNDFVTYENKLFRSRMAANKGNTPKTGGDTAYWSLYNESRLDNHRKATTNSLGTVKVPRNSGLSVQSDGSLRINYQGSRFLRINSHTNTPDVTNVASSGKHPSRIALCDHSGILTPNQVSKVNSIPDNISVSLSTKAESSLRLIGGNGILINNSSEGDLTSDKTISIRSASISNPGVIKKSDWTNQIGSNSEIAVTEKGISNAFKSVVTVYPNVRPTPSSDMGFAIYIKPAK